MIVFVYFAYGGVINFRECGGKSNCMRLCSQGRLNRHPEEILSFAK